MGAGAELVFLTLKVTVPTNGQRRNAPEPADKHAHARLLLPKHLEEPHHRRRKWKTPPLPPLPVLQQHLVGCTLDLRLAKKKGGVGVKSWNMLDYSFINKHAFPEIAASGKKKSHSSDKRRESRDA